MALLFSFVSLAIACTDSVPAPSEDDGHAGAQPTGATGGVSGTSAGSSTAGTGAGGLGGAAAGAGAGPPSDGGAGASAGSGSGAAAGQAGTGASSGTGGMTGARYPFPQNQRIARCTYPTSVDAERARAAYERFKTEVVTADGAGGFLRVKRPNSPGGETNSTVSEGIAYGMVLAVAMDDQPTFDALWQYSQLWVNEHGLMHWYIDAAGTMPLGSGGATDSDEDIAWSLVMADRQWGGSGSLQTDYLELARAQIERIWQWEVDHTRGDMLLPGDSWGSNVLFNPSYFAPNQYRIFGQVTGKVAEWNRVIDTGYRILEASLNQASGNAENGLVPAWCDENGVPKVPFDGGPTHYQYDSARTPFRIGQDYCYSGDERARAYLAKVSAFFARIGAPNIVDGYDLNGGPRPDADGDPSGPQSAVFVGSAAVGAMHDPTFASFISEANGLVATGELLARSRYYNLSWTVLSLLMLSGNLVEYPAP